MVDNGGTLLTQVIVVWVVAMSSTLEVSCPGGGTRCDCCHLGGGGGHIIDAGGSSRQWSSSLPSEVRVVVSCHYCLGGAGRHRRRSGDTGESSLSLSSRW